MTVTAVAPVRPSTKAAPAPVMGGEAWIVPFERGSHPWLTASTPAITVTDRRKAA